MKINQNMDGKTTDADLSELVADLTTVEDSLSEIFGGGTGTKGAAGIATFAYPAIVTMTTEPHIDNHLAPDDYNAGIFSLLDRLSHESDR
jgi:hypothetical protein